MAAHSQPKWWIAFLAGGLLALGCTSRTLPLPPPDIDLPLAAPNAQGLVVVRGSAQEGAAVGIMNDSTLSGVIVTSSQTRCGRSCAFEARISAKPGDGIRVWQFFETAIPTQFDVPAR